MKQSGLPLLTSKIAAPSTLHQPFLSSELRAANSNLLSSVGELDHIVRAVNVRQFKSVDLVVKSAASGKNRSSEVLVDQEQSESDKDFLAGARQVKWSPNDIDEVKGLIMYYIYFFLIVNAYYLFRFQI